MKTKFIILIFSMIILSQNCYAYLDMGSGSFIIQLILGFLFGSIVLLKVYWKKLVDFIKNLFK